MGYPVTITWAQIFTELRALLLDALSYPTPPAAPFLFAEAGGQPFGSPLNFAPVAYSAPEVVDGQDNRVPPPAGPDYVVITPRAQARLSTNIDEYDLEAGETARGQHTRADVQVDLYGPSSAEWAVVVSTILRSEWAADALVSCQPLYSDDPVQLPLADGEEQYEQRWMVRAVLQYNPSVLTPQQFADTLGPVGLHSY